MNHTIVRAAKGKQTVVAEGSLPKMNRRLKQLRLSTSRGVSCRGGGYKVKYHIVPPEKEE